MIGNKALPYTRHSPPGIFRIGLHGAEVKRINNVIPSLHSTTKDGYNIWDYIYYGFLAQLTVSRAA